LKQSYKEIMAEETKMNDQITDMKEINLLEAADAQQLELHPHLSQEER